MQTDDFEDRPGDNFTAVRISRDVSRTASVAGFYFGREAAGAAAFNRVAGVDLRVRPRPTVEIEAFGMRSAGDGVDADWAGRAGFRVDTRAHRARAGFLHVGDSFRHDMGYVRRRGVGTAFGKYARIFRPRDTSRRVREFGVGTEIESTTDDRYSTLLTRVGSINYEMLFADSAELRAFARTTFERIATPFGIGPVLTVQPGDYAYDDVGLEYQSNRSATISGTLNVNAGEFWSGSQKTVGGSLRYRFSAFLAVSATLSRSDIELPDGSFTGDLVGMRLDWSFNPRMFLNAFVQYNGEADTWLSNVRFNVIHRPLSDVYVVWNETRLPSGTRRALLLKYTQLFSF
jgi:hypothetical protein